MKDTIKRIRQEREGFTLAELLIVVAIIAVLVAIAIPVFSTQLEKSREAVDAANIRAAYAEIMTDGITGDYTTCDSHKVSLKQTKSGWQDSFDFPTNLTSGTTEPDQGSEVTFTWNTDHTGLTASIKLTTGE